MLRLGIVSSYGEECGNASNTHVVKREFAKHYDVEIIAVNAELLGRVNRKPDLRAVYATVEACDVVNIQFESGLYGDTPSVIAANVCEIIKNSKRLIFTMHRIYPQAKTRSNLLLLMYNLLRMRDIARTVRGWRGEWLVRRMARRIIAGLQRKYRAEKKALR